LLIQYTISYPPQLQAHSSICNLRASRAVVKRIDPPVMDSYRVTILILDSEIDTEEPQNINITMSDLTSPFPKRNIFYLN
jgi:hypothetical protein